jgi:hypothetical protein
MEATGSVTLYNPAGVFDPILGPDHSGTITTPYLYAENTWFVAEITRPSGSVYICLPAVLVNSDDYGIPGQSDVVNRTFGMAGLGGRCNGTLVMPPCILSNSGGAFEAPPSGP